MKHDPFHTNNSNIYIISYAYGILSTHLIQNQNKHKNRYRKKSYYYPANGISEISEYKR